MVVCRARDWCKHHHMCCEGILRLQWSPSPTIAIPSPPPYLPISNPPPPPAPGSTPGGAWAPAGSPASPPPTPATSAQGRTWGECQIALCEQRDERHSQERPTHYVWLAFCLALLLHVPFSIRADRRGRSNAMAASTMQCHLAISICLWTSGEEQKFAGMCFLYKCLRRVAAAVDYEVAAFACRTCNISKMWRRCLQHPLANHFFRQ